VMADNNHEWDEKIKKAASAILEADFLLVGTGAGFSADSGLPTFKDIAKVEAYFKRRLSYSAICRPHWNFEEPELFYGFFGKCFNDYRKAVPHQGYDVINKWKNQFFSTTSPLYEKLHQALSRYYTVDKSKGLPGPFFVYTSNIDGFHIRSGLNPNEVAEIHGSMELWQCSKPCREEAWAAPSDFVFNVNTTTMLASNTSLNADHTKNSGFVSNHPRCQFCGGPARPNILMFMDVDWIRNKTMWSHWSRGMEEILGNDTKLKLAVLEVGCGITVPTVRGLSERMLDRFGASRCTVIRVNLDYPNIDFTPRTVPTKAPPGLIGITGTCLEALLAIDAEIGNLQKASLIGQPDPDKERLTRDDLPNGADPIGESGLDKGLADLLLGKGEPDRETGAN